MAGRCRDVMEWMLKVTGSGKGGEGSLVDWRGKRSVRGKRERDEREVNFLVVWRKEEEMKQERGRENHFREEGREGEYQCGGGREKPINKNGREK